MVSRNPLDLTDEQKAAVMSLMTGMSNRWDDDMTEAISAAFVELIHRGKEFENASGRMMPAEALWDMAAVMWIGVLVSNIAMLADKIGHYPWTGAESDPLLQQALGVKLLDVLRQHNSLIGALGDPQAVRRNPRD